MKGGIYPNKGPGAPLQVRFGNITKKFWDHKKAERFLTGLRFKEDEGTYDERDYRRDNPLGFANQAGKWLEYRKEQVRDLRSLERHIGYAADFFGMGNVKSITFSQLEDYLHSLPQRLSGKTKANIFATLHAFFVWLKRRGEIKEVPDFPRVKYELGWRKTVDKATQRAILDEVYRQTYEKEPKVWIGIKWLCTYISVRPIELLHVKEGDFNLDLGMLFIRYKKNSNPHPVGLIDEDVEIIKSFPAALPHLDFFRYQNPHPRVRPGQRFGKHYFYDRWIKACEALGITGVDLYGGTRHSSTTALKEHLSPSRIQRTATKHQTNTAFARYFQGELQDDREVYALTAPGTHLVRNIDHDEKVKPLKLKGKRG